MQLYMRVSHIKLTQNAFVSVIVGVSSQINSSRYTFYIGSFEYINDVLSSERTL